MARDASVLLHMFHAENRDERNATLTTSGPLSIIPYEANPMFRQPGLVADESPTRQVVPQGHQSGSTLPIHTPSPLQPPLEGAGTA